MLKYLFLLLLMGCHYVDMNYRAKRIDDNTTVIVRVQEHADQPPYYKAGDSVWLTYNIQGQYELSSSYYGIKAVILPSSYDTSFHYYK